MRAWRALGELHADLIEVEAGRGVSEKSKTVVLGYFGTQSMSKKSKPPIGVGLWTVFSGLFTATAKPHRWRQSLTEGAHPP